MNLTLNKKKLKLTKNLMKKQPSKVKKKVVRSKKLNKEVNMIDIVKNKVMGIWNGLTVKKKITAGVIAVVIVIAIVS